MVRRIIIPIILVLLPALFVLLGMWQLMVMGNLNGLWLTIIGTIGSIGMTVIWGYFED